MFSSVLFTNLPVSLFTVFSFQMGWRIYLDAYDFISTWDLPAGIVSHQVRKTYAQ